MSYRVWPTIRQISCLWIKECWDFQPVDSSSTVLPTKDVSGPQERSLPVEEWHKSRSVSEGRHTHIRTEDHTEGGEYTCGKDNLILRCENGNKLESIEEIPE